MPTQAAAAVPNPVSATAISSGSSSTPMDVTVGVGMTTPAIDRSAPALFESPKDATPDKIKGEWLKNRNARAAAIVDVVTGTNENASNETNDDANENNVEASSDAKTDVDDTTNDEEKSANAQSPPEHERDSIGDDATREKTRLERIEEASKKARQAARYRREHDAELARTKQERDNTARELAEARRIAQRVQSVENALRDPQQAIGLMKKLGMTPEQLAQHVLNENTPEALIRAEAAKREAVEKELKSIKEAIDAKQREEDNARRKSDYLQRASNAEKYPNLAGHPSDALIAVGLDVARKLQTKYPNQVITDHAILYNLNKMYATAVPSKTEPTAQLSKAKTPSKAVSKTSGTSKPKPEQPRTLTNSQASTSFRKPEEWDKLSRTERISRLREGFRR